MPTSLTNSTHLTYESRLLKEALQKHAHRSDWREGIRRHRKPEAPFEEKEDEKTLGFERALMARPKALCTPMGRPDMKKVVAASSSRPTSPSAQKTLLDGSLFLQVPEFAGGTVKCEFAGCFEPNWQPSIVRRFLLRKCPWKPSPVLGIGNWKDSPLPAPRRNAAVYSIAARDQSPDSPRRKTSPSPTRSQGAQSDEEEEEQSPEFNKKPAWVFKGSNCSENLKWDFLKHIPGANQWTITRSGAKNNAIATAATNVDDRLLQVLYSDFAALLSCRNARSGLPNIFKRAELQNGVSATKSEAERQASKRAPPNSLSLPISLFELLNVVPFPTITRWQRALKPTDSTKETLAKRIARTLAQNATSFKVGSIGDQPLGFGSAVEYLGDIRRGSLSGNPKSNLPEAGPNHESSCWLGILPVASEIHIAAKGFKEVWQFEVNLERLGMVMCTLERALSYKLSGEPLASSAERLRVIVPGDDGRSIIPRRGEGISSDWVIHVLSEAADDDHFEEGDSVRLLVSLVSELVDEQVFTIGAWLNICSRWKINTPLLPERSRDRKSTEVRRSVSKGTEERRSRISVIHVDEQSDSRISMTPVSSGQPSTQMTHVDTGGSSTNSAQVRRGRQSRSRLASTRRIGSTGRSWSKSSVESKGSAGHVSEDDKSQHEDEEDEETFSRRSSDGRPRSTMAHARSKSPKDRARSKSPLRPGDAKSQEEDEDQRRSFPLETPDEDSSKRLRKTRNRLASKSRTASKSSTGLRVRADSADDKNQQEEENMVSPSRRSQRRKKTSMVGATKEMTVEERHRKAEERHFHEAEAMLIRSAMHMTAAACCGPLILEMLLQFAARTMNVRGGSEELVMMLLWDIVGWDSPTARRLLRRFCRAFDRYAKNGELSVSGFIKLCHDAGWSTSRDHAAKHSRFSAIFADVVGPGAETVGAHFIEFLLMTEIIMKDVLQSHTRTDMGPDVWQAMDQAAARLGGGAASSRGKTAATVKQKAPKKFKKGIEPTLSQKCSEQERKAWPDEDKVDDDDGVSDDDNAMSRLVSAEQPGHRDVELPALVGGGHSKHAIEKLGTPPEMRGTDDCAHVESIRQSEHQSPELLVPDDCTAHGRQPEILETLPTGQSRLQLPEITNISNDSMREARTDLSALLSDDNNGMLDPPAANKVEGQATYTFKGKMGVLCGDDGIVQTAFEGKPACTKGIRAGDRIVNVDTDSFSNERLRRAEDSGNDYDVTVRDEEIKKQTVDAVEALSVRNSRAWVDGLVMSAHGVSEEGFVVKAEREDRVQGALDHDGGALPITASKTANHGIAKSKSQPKRNRDKNLKEELEEQITSPHAGRTFSAGDTSPDPARENNLKQLLTQ